MRIFFLAFFGFITSGELFANPFIDLQKEVVSSGKTARSYIVIGRYETQLGVFDQVVRYQVRPVPDSNLISEKFEILMLPAAELSRDIDANRKAYLAEMIRDAEWIQRVYLERRAKSLEAEEETNFSPAFIQKLVDATPTLAFHSISFRVKRTTDDEILGVNRNIVKPFGLLRDEKTDWNSPSVEMRYGPIHQLQKLGALPKDYPVPIEKLPEEDYLEIVLPFTAVEVEHHGQKVLDGEKIENGHFGIVKGNENFTAKERAQAVSELWLWNYLFLFKSRTYLTEEQILRSRSLQAYSDRASWRMHQRFFKMQQVYRFLDSTTRKEIYSEFQPLRESKDKTLWRVVSQPAQTLKDIFHAIVKDPKDQGVWLESSVFAKRPQDFELRTLEDYVSVILAPSESHANEALADFEDFLILWFAQFWATKNLQAENPHPEIAHRIEKMEGDRERALRLIQIFEQTNYPDLKRRLGFLQIKLAEFLPSDCGFQLTHSSP